ncbi:c-1-tetrahydrofolate synthase cytoplasmic [Anaeramoeba flamelloides]|uniref:C-1-tetrahydrofolate synthase cytoplasmic n=1 Tax=Anaeramoeba flamelloides TaxID=1746091 RepID=A0AAV7YBT9_9EUKA|nr:c-1-tetrahydrofolate synthase cytoplasmic [Anaeramoeba flamelloides]
MSRKDKIIDGKKIASEIQEELYSEIQVLKTVIPKKPGLAVILVGNRKDSQAYVRMKKKMARRLEIVDFEKNLPENVSQEELLQVVKDYNNNPDVNGILVQLPLPKHIDEETILNTISPEKDVDGFSPINMGNLCMKGREPLFVPCTPKGCIELLKRSGVNISGKKAVIVGRSNIVGLPISFLLLHENATITICHSRTKDIAKEVKDADIVIAALGAPEFVKGDWIKKGAVIIDVGINAVPDKTKKRGYRLVGDVDFEGCLKNASKITPVPGGVGPQTIIQLMKSTVEGFKRQNGIKKLL